MHFFSYRPLKQSWSRVVDNYDNIFVDGDLNINLLHPKSDSWNHFSDSKDTFSQQATSQPKVYFFMSYLQIAKNISEDICLWNWHKRLTS